MAVRPLNASALRRAADSSLPRFRSTDDLKDIEGVLGQDRAVEAIELGAGMARSGYNLFVMGARGAGRHTIAGRLLARYAAEKPVPDDWVYVHNFEQPYQPNAIRLPAGVGCKLRAEMETFVDEIRVTLPALFESDEYRTRLGAIQASFEQRHEKTFQALREQAQAENVALLQGPRGFVFAPLVNGEVMTPEAFQALPEEKRKEIEELIRKYETELKKIVEELPKWHKEFRDSVRELNQEVSRAAVTHAMTAIRANFSGYAECTQYFDNIQTDLMNEIELFLPAQEGQQMPAFLAGMRDDARNREGVLHRYEVNVVVDNSEDGGAPIIFENNPSLLRLVGRVEHVAKFGTLVTDYTLIKPGSLHRANGGYLVIDTAKLFTQPLAWEALKRSLQAGEIRIESPGELLGYNTTISLDPEPIPLDVKVVLVGEREHFYLLNRFDPDFGNLFKVLADLNEVMPWDKTNAAGYAALIASIAREEGLMPFTRDGVAALLEFASRNADDAERFSLIVSTITDVMREADYMAATQKQKSVNRKLVEATIAAQIHRADRIRERSQEQITREIMLIATDGEQVGQINGLSVLDLGNFRFGRPSRITARIGLGSGRVLDIEREVDLGGPLHSKGVMILSGYLTATFGIDKPLPLSATLAFEQSYGGVDGDSASSTELYALLSAVSGVPIRQSLAVTGSVNQYGEVQAIGGVNEKIEGYFDICVHRGLSGEQGVLIPKANTKHLMLRDDVIAAVKAKKFNIYPVETIEQGIELLTGMRAGSRGKNGEFPQGTLFRAVDDRLDALIETRKKFMKHEPDEDEAEGGKDKRRGK
jgi:predicted ATP-dependent protease